MSIIRTDPVPLERLIKREELLVVGAEYSLETGVVDVFDLPPPAVD